MAAEAIRVIIDRALEHERLTGALRAELASRLPELETQLVLGEGHPLDNVMAFLRNYIESVPGSLALVTAFSKRLGFYDYAAPFLAMAEDYFLHPPADVPQGEGLATLLDEVNDQHFRHMQRPLLPLDLTEANTIVHHLLGESMAIRLEQLVETTTAQIFNREYVWDRVRALPGAAPAAEEILSSSKLGTVAGSIRLRLGT
jgi:hypothetical protein